MQNTGAPDIYADREDSIDCSVLVPVLNEERHIVDSVAAMLEQRFPGRLEAILVDGGSTDRTRSIVEEMARRDPRLRVFDNPGGSTPSGLNVALRHARGRWVARMDAHTTYPPDYIALGVARLERGGTSWVSGPQVPRGQGAVSRAVELALRTPLGRGGSRKWGSARAADGPGAEEYELDSGVFAGVWERATLLRYGGWDEGWPRNQDSEMAGRFLARGERLVCLPQMAARYTPRDSIRSLWRQYWQYGDYREKTALRHPHTMRRSHLIPPSLVATAGAAVVAPRGVRRVARVAVGAYASLLVAAGVGAAGQADSPADALLVPVVLPVMHLAHGAGSIKGAIRRGPPLAAIAMVLGRKQLADQLSRPVERVHAPSLDSSGMADDL
jgi:glycosyltransferase involved in cell wall biosynthesis